MALVSGAQIGPYTIGEEIGSGGMGVVYRATDKNLKRDVAVKALPESLAADAERLARFQREAQVLASLNHPNIAQIYGLEKSDGTTALIMELVEGPTLADRIAKGPLPPDEALGIAMQIAEGLKAAHSQNIVHRDLKPANVKLRPDGTVKVLDFGIAKALEPDSIRGEPQSPMLTTPATQVGVILGTAAYMSPEQAKGKPVDQRTDIWAFGCLLYEMLTGQLAFGAEDVPTTLARVIANETNLDSLPAVISPAVRQTIALCLQKDLDKRLHAMGDVRLALQGAFELAPPHASDAAATISPIDRWRPLPIAMIAIVAIGITAFTMWIAMQPGAQPVNRFDYDLPEGLLLRQTGFPVVAVSPDGRQFVYNSSEGLFARGMDQLVAQLIPGTEPALTSPVFSPNSQEVAYFDGQLKRIAVSGGAPVLITDIEPPFGLNWEADGTLIFGQTDGIYRVSANGGTPELIIPRVEGEVSATARMLPDGDSVMLTVTTNMADWDSSQIVAQSLSTGERTVLLRGGRDARYLPSGHLVYAYEDGLFGVAFDPDTLTVSGGATPLVQGVMGTVAAASHYSVSNDGTLVYVTGSITPDTRTLVWVHRDGSEEPINAPPRAYTSPRISPDGERVALDVRDQELDVWTWNFVRETLTRLTFDPRQDESPVWSPDGQRIAYSLSQGGGVAAQTTLLSRPADGTGSPEALAELSGQSFPTSFLPDATGFLVYGSVVPGQGDDISIFRLEGERTSTPLLETTFEESYPALSPDGRWLAYVSDESGDNVIYVRPFPDINAGRWQVGTGTQPLWAPDGEELFYRNGESMVAVSVEPDASFATGNPRVLFEDRYILEQGGPNYGISSDGERFLMIKPVEGPSMPPQIIVVENWFTEVERLLPTE